MLPRLPPFSATRSTVLGVDRENLAQPPSSGPAVPLVLNHTACTVTHTCEYCAGVLPVSDASDLVPQPTSSPPPPKVAAMSATCRRWFMPVPVPWIPRMMQRISLAPQRGRRRQVCPIVVPCRAPRVPERHPIGRGSVKSVKCAPRETPLPGQRSFRRFDLPLTSSLAADRRGAFACCRASLQRGFSSYVI